MTDARERDSEPPIELGAAKMKALAHSIRLRLISELADVAAARTSDLAAAVETAVNKTSYHLAKLADAGVITKTEPPSGSTDGRETWWKLASEGGITWDFTDPDVDAVALEIRRQASELRAQAEVRAYALNRDRNWHMMGAAFGVRLTRAEADDYWARLRTIVDELSKLGRDRVKDDADYDVEYMLDLGFFPTRVKHPERGLNHDAPDAS